MNAMIDSIGLIAGLLRSMPLILSNVVTLVLSLAIIVLKIRYREPPRGGRNR